MIASLKPYLLAGENVSGVSSPDTPGMASIVNARVEAGAIRAIRPAATLAAANSRRLLRLGLVDRYVDRYVEHTGTSIDVCDMEDTVLATAEDTTAGAVLRVVPFEHGAFIVEQTSKKLFWFDEATVTITLLTANTLHVANFKQRLVFSNPGTFFDVLFNGARLTLSTLGETQLPGATEISAKSTRTVCWGGIVSDWLAVMLDPTSLCSAISDTKVVEDEDENSYLLSRCYAGQLYIRDGSLDMYYEDENGDLVLHTAGEGEANPVVFVPALSSYYGFLESEDSAVLRYSLDDFLRTRDWGYTVLPGGYDITGVWATANEVLVSTEAALWLLRPLTSEPSFSVTKIAEFGALAAGGNLQSTIFVAKDGKTHQFVGGELKQLRADNSASYVTICADELDGAVYMSNGTSTRWLRGGTWSTLAGNVEDAHNGAIIASYSSNAVELLLDSTRLDDVRLKCVRSVRVIGSGVTYVQVRYRELDSAPWKVTANVLVDASGTALFSVSCYEFKLMLTCASGAVVHDILVDYDITSKSNFMRTRRV